MARHFGNQNVESQSGKITGAVADLIYEENGLNIKIIAGHLQANSVEWLDYHDLLFVNGSNSTHTLLTTRIAEQCVDGRSCSDRLADHGQDLSNLLVWYGGSGLLISHYLQLTPIYCLSAIALSSRHIKEKLPDHREHQVVLASICGCVPQFHHSFSQVLLYCAFGLLGT